MSEWNSMKILVALVLAANTAMAVVRYLNVNLNLPDNVIIWIPIFILAGALLIGFGLEMFGSKHMGAASFLTFLFTAGFMAMIYFWEKFNLDVCSTESTTPHPSITPSADEMDRQKKVRLYTVIIWSSLLVLWLGGTIFTWSSKSSVPSYFS